MFDLSLEVLRVVEDAAIAGTGVHAVMGSGGAPEGVLTAAALRCLNGEIQGRLVVKDDAQKERMQAMGIRDPEQIYTTHELAQVPVA